MQKKEVLGVGWDVGGWCGSRQAVAVARWENREPKLLGWSDSFSVGDLPEEAGLDAFIHRAWKRCPASVLDRYQVVVAIDAPLAFPKEFVRFLNGCPLDARPDQCFIENRLAFRDCDRIIHESGKTPLSASFDKLGNPATVAMFYARRWSSGGQLFMLPFQDAPRGASVIIEVYPALAKDKKGECVEPFVAHIPEDVPKRTDAYDACTCALMGLAFRSENESVLPSLLGPREGTAYRLQGHIFHAPTPTTSTQATSDSPCSRSKRSARSRHLA